MIAFGGLTVAAFLIVTLIQIVFRNVFKQSLIWANDVSLILFIWAIFLGAAVAVKQKRHYVMDVIPDRYPLVNKFFDILAVFAGFIFFYIIVKYGLVYLELSKLRISTSVSIPQSYFFAVIPISGVLMAFFNLEILIEDIQETIDIVKGRKGAVQK